MVQKYIQLRYLVIAKLTYMSDMAKAIFFFIVKEFRFSGPKNNDANLHALHRHQESYIESILCHEYFQLLSNEQTEVNAYRFFDNKRSPVGYCVDAVNLHRDQNKGHYH